MQEKDDYSCSTCTIITVVKDTQNIWLSMWVLSLYKIVAAVLTLDSKR